MAILFVHLSVCYSHVSKRLDRNTHKHTQSHTEREREVFPSYVDPYVCANLRPSVRYQLNAARLWTRVSIVQGIVCLLAPQRQPTKEGQDELTWMAGHLLSDLAASAIFLLLLA